MDAARWQKLKQIFTEAVDTPYPRRSEIIDRYCNGDAEMRGELEKMLAAEDDESRGLEKNAFEHFNWQYDNAAPERIGKYRIVREIGRGGMGAVFEAIFETEDFSQRVALKIIKRGMDTDQIVRRFRHEQKILASLVHPNITQFIDGGMTEDDLPYYAMEFVEGRSIDDYCREEGLSLDQRVRLFRQVCSAVQYAHQNLIIHRDLKPTNILVTADGQAKLLDFGIGKIMGPETEAGTATQLGMMTPAYASPEQVRGEQISTSSDIYSLGVVLYELLTGQKPYTFSANSQLEIERAICQTEPRRPSSLRDLSHPSEIRPFSVSQLRGDLDNIILKCLRKEPVERYSSVHEFSEDLRRYGTGLPVMARAHTFKYRAGKFISRNRIGVAAAAIVFVSLCIGITVAIWQAHRAEQQRILAENRFADVRQLANNVVFKYHDAIADLPGSTAVREMLVSDALAYLDGLAQESTGDVTLQKELAIAYLKMGDVQGKMYTPNIGDTGGALVSYQKSINLLEEVVSQEDSDTEAKDNLIQAYDNLAFLLLRSGGGGEAKALVEKALALFEQIPKTEAKSHERTLKLIDLYIRFGDTSTAVRSEALAAHMRTLPLIEDILAAGVADHDTLKMAARVYQRIGTDHYWSGQYAEDDGDTTTATSHFEQSLTFQRRSLAAAQQLNELAPGRPDSQRYLAAAYGNAAESLSAVGSSDEAMQMAEKFKGLVDAALQQDPNNQEAQLSLSIANELFAKIYVRLGDDARAIHYMLEALSVEDAIFRADSHNQEVLGRILQRHKLLSELYLERGDTGKAAYHRDKPASYRAAE